MSTLDPGFDLDKPLYTISVASEILETHPRTLMLYEDVGLIQPFRTSTNRRRYSQRDIRKLQVIQYLTRGTIHPVPLRNPEEAWSRAASRPRGGVPTLRRDRLTGRPARWLDTELTVGVKCWQPSK